ncbi:MAG TPA: hypothetical protein PLE50_00030 [Rhabdaerophilum sp.]|nr:hypothetical protein [Rhabdaerophilum sp.]
MDDYQLAFEQSLDDAIEEAEAWLAREDIVRVMEAKLAELKAERLDG